MLSAQCAVYNKRLYSFVKIMQMSLVHSVVQVSQLQYEPFLGITRQIYGMFTCKVMRLVLLNVKT